MKDQGKMGLLSVMKTKFSNSNAPLEITGIAAKSLSRLEAYIPSLSLVKGT